MHRLIASLWIGALAQEGAPEPAPVPARDELLARVAALGSATRYAFAYEGGQVKEEDEPAPTDAQVPPPEPDSIGAERMRNGQWQIRWAKGEPQHFVRGRAEFWGLEGRFIALGKADTWVPVELPDESKERGSSRGTPMGRMAADLQRIPLPHRLVADLGSKLGDVAREEVDGIVQFTATYKPDAVRKLMGSGGTKQDAPEEGDAGGATGTAEEPAPIARAYTGRFVAKFSADAITEISIELSSKSTDGERRVRRQYLLSEIGTAKLSIPEPAMKALLDQQ
jgi:hypothetical protein